jgi:hypothetical protein
MPGRVAPPGVSRPFSGFGGGIRMFRACLARHRPSSGFLTPSTGCSPSGLADTLGPLPLLGFSFAKLFRAGRPWRIAAPAASFHPCCSTASNSEEYEVESSTGSQMLEPARPGSTAVVPELPKPPSKHMAPEPSQGLSPPLFPSHALALGVRANTCVPTTTRRTGVSGCLASPGVGGSTRDPQLPWGSCCFRKTLRRLPMLHSRRHRHAHRSRKSSWARGPRQTPDAVARSERRFRVIELSKSHLLGQRSRRY